jgi:hypothetical protein
LNPDLQQSLSADAALARTRGVEGFSHHFISSGESQPRPERAPRSRLVALACDPDLERPLRYALKVLRRIEAPTETVRTFVCPLPSEDDASVLRSLLPRGASAPPVGGNRPALLQGNGQLRFLLTPGSASATPPSVPATDVETSPADTELIVAFLQDSGPATWREALAWCDAFVMVLPVYTAAFARYYDFIADVAEDAADVSFHWAPAAELTEEAAAAIDKQWRDLTSRHLTLDAARLTGLDQVHAGEGHARASFVRWCRFMESLI